MAQRSISTFSLIVCLVALSACGLRGPASTVAPPSATPLPPSATPSSAPTTPVPSPTTAATATATAAGSQTETPTPGASATLNTTGAGIDKAEFLVDVTVPDGTDFAPGATFVKTWWVKNAGTSTWVNGYVFVFAKGDRLGGPDSVPIAGPVPPGGTLEISVNLAAPDKLGSYTGFWQFRSAAGQPFGIGPDGNQPVYVQIDVTAAGGATAEPTGVAGPLQVSAASLTVDRPSVSDTCPQTFRFSGSITSAGAGSMTYRLEATSETPGFQYVLPDTNTSTFGGPGPRTLSVSYDLVFSGSVTGQVWLHVLSPNEVNSDKVSFSLNCQSTPNAP